MELRISRKIQVQHKNPDGFEHYEPYEISILMEESDIPYTLDREHELTPQERMVYARDTIMSIIDKEIFIMGVRTKEDMLRYKNVLRERRERENDVYAPYRINVNGEKNND